MLSFRAAVGLIVVNVVYSLVVVFVLPIETPMIRAVLCAVGIGVLFVAALAFGFAKRGADENGRNHRQKMNGGRRTTYVVGIGLVAQAVVLSILAYCFRNTTLGGLFAACAVGLCLFTLLVVGTRMLCLPRTR